MGQHLERSNTEGAQLRNLFEETRNFNASVAPAATNLKARGAQLFTRVSTMQNQETELQGQLQNVQQEIVRINALMNQSQIRNKLMNTGNQVTRLQTEVSYLRTLVERNLLPKVDTQKIFEL